MVYLVVCSEDFSWYFVEGRLGAQNLLKKTPRWIFQGLGVQMTGTMLIALYSSYFGGLKLKYNMEKRHQPIFDVEIWWLTLRTGIVSSKNSFQKGFVQ